MGGPRENRRKGTQTHSLYTADQALIIIEYLRLGLIPPGHLVAVPEERDLDDDSEIAQIVPMPEEQAQKPDRVARRKFRKQWRKILKRGRGPKHRKPRYARMLPKQLARLNANRQILVLEKGLEESAKAVKMIDKSICAAKKCAVSDMILQSVLDKQK